jgi:hypothetical protein
MAQKKHPNFVERRYGEVRKIHLPGDRVGKLRHESGPVLLVAS